MADPTTALLPSRQQPSSHLRRCGPCRREERRTVRVVACGLVSLAVALVALAHFFGNDDSCTSSLFHSFSSVSSSPVDTPLWDAAVRRAHVLDQDGGTSVPIGDNRVLWLFSDTIMNCSSIGDQYCPSWGWVMTSNTAVELTLDDSRRVVDAQYVVDTSSSSMFEGFPLEIVSQMPFESSKSFAQWPTSSSRIGDRTFVWWNVVERLSTGGPWSFQGWGHGVGVLNETSLLVNRLRNDTAGMVAPSAVVPGDAAVGGWFLYFIRDHTADPNADPNPRDVVVAHVGDEAGLTDLDPTSTIFYDDGGGWGATFRTARAVVSDFGSPELSATRLSFVTDGGDAPTHPIVLFSVDAFSRHVVARTAWQPEGPFDCPTSVFEHAGPESEWIYFVEVHPEATQLVGTSGADFVLSYCVFHPGAWVVPNVFRLSIRK